MKKILQATDEELKINEFCKLRRLQENCTGEIDTLVLDCLIPHYGKLWKTYDIKARTYEEVVKEVERDIEDYFQFVGAELSKTFANGKINY